MKYVVCYFLFINIIAAVITLYDKWLAKNNKWRISERTIFLFSFAGAAVGVYLTMLLIRHKTLHKRFMIGLPLIIILHLAILFAAIFIKF